MGSTILFHGQWLKFYLCFMVRQASIGITHERSGNWRTLIKTKRSRDFKWKTVSRWRKGGFQHRQKSVLFGAECLFVCWMAWRDDFIIYLRFTRSLRVKFFLCWLGLNVQTRSLIIPCLKIPVLILLYLSWN